MSLRTPKPTRVDTTRVKFRFLCADTVLTWVRFVDTAHKIIDTADDTVSKSLTKNKLSKFLFWIILHFNNFLTNLKYIIVIYNVMKLVLSFFPAFFLI
jgi:hypothetical protein